MTYKTLPAIENRIQKIKRELLALGEMRPGSLSQQSHDPDKRRTYWQLSYTYKMRSRTEYIRDRFLKDTKTQVKNYKRFKALIDEWVALSIEHAKLKISQEARGK